MEACERKKEGSSRTPEGNEAMLDVRLIESLMYYCI